jgi:hypothetical protein
MAFAALNFIDIAVRGRDAASLVMAALLLLGCGIAYVLGLRPAVVADEGGFTVRNPLRDVRVPWPASKKIEAGEALTFRFEAEDVGERKVKAWVLTSSPRSQAKAERRAARDRSIPEAHAVRVKGRTPVTYAAEQLNEIADRQRPQKGSAQGRGVIRWSRQAVGALAVPAVLVVAASVVAML